MNSLKALASVFLDTEKKTFNSQAQTDQKGNQSKKLFAFLQDSLFT